jgi:hypothetical protein
MKNRKDGRFFCEVKSGQVLCQPKRTEWVKIKDRRFL